MAINRVKCWRFRLEVHNNKLFQVSMLLAPFSSSPLFVERLYHETERSGKFMHLHNFTLINVA
jgi:hypothetical protein